MSPISPATRKFLTIACLVLAVLSLTAASGVTVAAIYQNRVLPKTFVAGAAVGGVKAADASTTITETARDYSRQPITLALNDQTAQVRLGDLGVTIDTNQTASQITNQADSWQWVSYSYWRNFFQKKNIGLTYTIDDSQLEKTLQSKFSLAKAAQNAKLSVVNNVIVVEPGVIGATFDLVGLKTNIAMYLAGSAGNTMAISAQISDPDITTDSANQTKAVIEQTIPTVYLVNNGQNLNITPTGIYPEISFTAKGSHYDWQIDQSKLAAYIDSTISKKINVKTVAQVTMSDTGLITTQGVDGKNVDSKTLASKIIAAIINNTDTKVSPISVPINTISFTSKIAYPNYTLGTFPGLYLDVSLSTQRISVINGSTLVAQYLISSGGWKTPTPVGTFYIFNKISEAYSPDFKLWMPMWNGLATSPDGTGYLGYGIHALVCWDKACTNREGVTHIGTPVSHGCIRVDDNGIPWIYNNAPIGTPVIIHQ